MSQKLNYDSNCYIKVETKLVPNRVLEWVTNGFVLLNILVPVKLTDVSGDLTVTEGSNATLGTLRCGTARL